jgi:hypothetical protein
MRILVRIDRVLGGHNAPVHPNRKKTIPTESATVGGKMKQAEQPGKSSHSVFAGNALQVHIPAHSAVHESHILDRDGPGIKTQVAGAATPGPQQQIPKQIVLSAAPSGAPRTVAMTGWTNQSRTP